MSQREPIPILVSTPLEAEHVDRIRAAGGDRIEVLYRPDLLPPARYVADHNGPADWRRTPDQEREWESLVARAEVAWDFPPATGRPLLERMPNLRWVQTTSAGVGPKVRDLGLAETDLVVTTASGIHATPLAEFVFAVLLHYVKLIPQLQEWQRAHQWDRFCAGELDGMTLGLVGPGRIGAGIIRRARAFDMKVWAMGRRNDPARARDLGVDRLFAREDLREMLAGADVLVLACPHTPETEGLIGPAEIAAMKPGIVLVNIARGIVIDEAAMTDALRSGQIAFAGLDVFQTEPLPATSPLWDLPNVLVNPHSASTAWRENERITDIFIANLERYLEGRPGEMTPLLDKRLGY